jgi:hypothetical protein
MRATTQHNPNPARWQSSVQPFHVGFKSGTEDLHQDFTAIHRRPTRMKPI